MAVARTFSAMAALLLCVAVGCADSSPVIGATLVAGYKTVFGLAPLKPGTQLGLLDVYLQNGSRSPITIDSVSSLGRGLGTVIKVVEVKIAPTREPMARPYLTAWAAAPTRPTRP